MNHVSPTTNTNPGAQPQVRHVNLMVDTIITNVASDDIRTLVRALLSSSPAHVTDQFCSLAKSHLHHMPIPPAPGALELFTSDPEPTPTPAFETVLARARARYGAGLGSSSILVLLPIVDLAGSIQWREGSAVEDALSIVDCDIAAALLHAKEELAQQGETAQEARDALTRLRSSLETVEEKVEDWGGDFPFERSQDAITSMQL
ncbi:hypothetical protein FRC14_005353 [Serendipita sp. 396]|nr:hypothetical protein FRC14_005353 [Serendipita sp. 396]KAG8783259.1 hypothetical protein FRC15_005522 [Serendipita sp. 397]KAG8797128.1 hypothetical protein FRC16_009191 [Serendipita sp. 398]KAG8865715.1 hypothetical protein FRC20_009558 [Serendipita sp. 405]